MRGVVPNGVTLPLGAIRVMAPPGREAQLLRQPRADDHASSPLSKCASAPGDKVLGNDGEACEIGARACRAPCTPGLTPFWLAITWPSTIGAARVTPGTARSRARHRVEIGQEAAPRLHRDMAVQAQDAFQEFVAKTVHHRHHDDQGGHAQRDARPAKSREITETKLSWRLARR